jgi:hypothetical protein
MWIVLFLVFIPSYAFGQLSAMNCERLDPRASISSETETRISASVKTVLKVAQAGGEVQRKAKEEIQNLSTTATSKDQIEARWIYLFCEMLRTSGNLSEVQKKQYFDAVFQAIKPSPQPPPAKDGKNKDRTGRVKTPNITILGALPINLWKQNPLPREPSQASRAPFGGHQLAFIIKVQNNTNSPIRVNVAVLEGCAPISAHTVQILGSKKLLIEGETLPPSNDPAYGELEKTTIQRIKVSGTIRAGSQDLESGVAYIGILFPVRSGGGATMEAPQTVSIKRKCDAIKKWISQPSISQLLNIGAIKYELPKDIAPEFRDGRLKIHLHTTKEILELNPKVIGKLYSVREEHWQSLLLPEMYEVPDQDYPPRRG